jgi:hypothetical protein
MNGDKVAIQDTSISVGTSTGTSTGARIAQTDKKYIELQHQLEAKEDQLRRDYARIKRDVKQNPYLKTAIDEYNNYFEKGKEEKKKKIKALTELLNYIEANNDHDNEDIFNIKREIINIKRN